MPCLKFERSKFIIAVFFAVQVCKEGLWRELNLVEASLLLLSQPNVAAVVEAIFTLNPEMQRRLEVLLWD